MQIVPVIKFYNEIGESIFRNYSIYGRVILDFFHIIFQNLFYILLFFSVIVSIVYFYMSIYSLFNKKKAQEKKFIPDKAPFVTIQIPTFNELAALRCAKKCLNFDYPKEKYEIIIGDDSNVSKVSAEIDKFASKHNSVKVTRRGDNIGFKAGNLNHMLKNSKGDILVLFDSDFVPEKDFLKRIVTPFIYDPNISGVQSRWKFIDRNRNLVSLMGSTIGSVFHYICLPFLTKKSNISFLCGSAEAVKKKDLLDLGGWETGSLTEDIEFSLRLLKNGKKIVYLDTLECNGEVPHKSKDLYKQQMRWAYGVVYSFREHFKSLYSSKKLSTEEKFYVSFFGCGYFLSFLLLGLFVTGAIAFITDAPGPIDFVRLFAETGRNIALSSGIVFASVFAMIKSENLKKLFAMIAASFSIGLIVTYYVNVGIIKVFLNKPMQWFMLNKEGNKVEA